MQRGENIKGKQEKRVGGKGLAEGYAVIPGSSVCVQNPNIYLKSLAFLWKSGKGLNFESGFLPG